MQKKGKNESKTWKISTKMTQNPINKSCNPFKKTYNWKAKTHFELKMTIYQNKYNL